jgi:hypothetical protein
MIFVSGVVIDVVILSLSKDDLRGSTSILIKGSIVVILSLSKDE